MKGGKNNLPVLFNPDNFNSKEQNTLPCNSNSEDMPREILGFSCVAKSCMLLRTDMK